MKKITFALVIASGLLLSSCYTPPTPGTGVIRVVDNNDFLVPGATVQLSQPGQNNTGYIVVTGLTNLTGEYSYTHEPPLEVILNIRAYMGSTVPANPCNMIRIVPGETSYKTVTLQ